jgi:hypothetical protein
MLALCSEYGDDARKKILPYSNWPTTDDSHLHAHHAGQNTLKAAGQAGDAHNQSSSLPNHPLFPRRQAKMPASIYARSVPDKFRRSCAKFPLIYDTLLDTRNHWRVNLETLLMHLALVQANGVVVSLSALMKASLRSVSPLTDVIEVPCRDCLPRSRTRLLPWLSQAKAIVPN